MCKRLLSWVLILALLLGLSPMAAPMAVSAEPTIENSWEMYQNFQAIDPTLFLYDPAAYLKTYYGYDDAQVDYVCALANQIAYGCTAPQDKIFSVVRYLATTIGYDYDYYTHNMHPYPPRDPIAVLNNRYAVCAGYAECSEIFLQFLGVPCVTVISPDHAWNMAYIGSRWMLFDVTWISGSRYEYGTLHTDSTLHLTWYDFSFQQAMGEANHRPLSMPYTQYGGTLYSVSSHLNFTSFTIPSTVTCVAKGAFSSNMHLKQVTIPDSVTVIEDHAFYDCENLQQVTFGNSVTYIGKEAFAFCYALESVTLPSSVAQLDYRAFYVCKNLASLTIPDRLTTIGDEALATYCADTTVYGSLKHPLRGTVESLGLRYVARHPSGYLYGDADQSGTVNSTDARLLLQLAVGKIKSDTVFLAVTDVNGDGQYNSTDARLILQFAVGKIHSF